MPRRYPTHGFTILELIVAIGVSLIMLFLINQLFFETSRAVSMGVSISDIIATARGTGSQFERDARAMKPPISGTSGGGVLVIINRSVKMYYLSSLKEIRERNVRMDQVYWIRDLDLSSGGFGEMPIAPRGNDTYAPPTRKMVEGADAIRVWYGHVQKVAPDGSVVGSFGNGINLYANQLAFGRHALMFVKQDAAKAASDPPSPYQPPTTAHVRGAWPAAPVNGITGPGGSTLRDGIADVAFFAYADPNHPIGTFTGSDASTAASGSPEKTLWAVGINNDAYKQRALDFAFLSQNMLGNPAPVVDPSNPLPAGLVAQTHTIMADNISDFIVEFAADVKDDDPAGGGADGKPDEEADNVLWYGMDWGDPKVASPGTWATLPPPAHQPQITGTDAAGNAFTAWVFRHDFPSHWPYMIRIRYRVHDKRGQIMGDSIPTDPEHSLQNVGSPGKWFEQIIEVARQPG